MAVASRADLWDWVAAGGIPWGAPVVGRRLADEPVQLDALRERVEVVGEAQGTALLGRPPLALA
ncbi:MAG: hypothetical protein ACXVHQ_41785 [Solirubrobacteraceae bacterium]